LDAANKLPVLVGFSDKLLHQTMVHTDYVMLQCIEHTANEISLCK
jgi:hypothetical protein